MIMGREGSQIEPFVFLHEGRDKEVPGWIPRGLDVFPVARYWHVCSHTGRLIKLETPTAKLQRWWSGNLSGWFFSSLPSLPSPTNLIASKQQLKRRWTNKCLSTCHSKLDPPPWHANKEQARVNKQKQQCVRVNAEEEMILPRMKHWL